MTFRFNSFSNARFALILSLFLFAPAQAEWLVCSDCVEPTQRQLATQYPPDRFAVTTVNILDDVNATVRSYRVSVFYDYEFRTYFRFAQSAPTSASAMREFTAWRSFRDILVALQADGLPVAIDSVAAFLRLSSGAVVDAALNASGLQAVFADLGGLTGIATFPDASVDLRFTDQSSATIALSPHATTSQMTWDYRPSSAESPTGETVPDNMLLLRHLDHVGDDTSTRYLADHVYQLWQFRVFVRDFLGAGRRYRTTCDLDDPTGVTCRAVEIG